LSSKFYHDAESNWCASVGEYDNEVVLYENYWTDTRYYICQYDCE